MTNVEAIMADGAIEYAAVVNAGIRRQARELALEPRRPKMYDQFLEDDRLRLDIRIEPDSALWCWLIAVELMRWALWSNTPAGQRKANAFQRTTASMLLQSEFERMAAARAAGERVAA